jgi:hypothetical protein
VKFAVTITDNDVFPGAGQHQVVPHNGAICQSQNLSAGSARLETIEKKVFFDNTVEKHFEFRYTNFIFNKKCKVIFFIKI